MRFAYKMTKILMIALRAKNINYSLTKTLKTPLLINNSTSSRVSVLADLSVSKLPVVR